MLKFAESSQDVTVNHSNKSAFVLSEDKLRIRRNLISGRSNLPEHSLGDPVSFPDDDLIFYVFYKNTCIEIY